MYFVSFIFLSAYFVSSPGPICSCDKTISRMFLNAAVEVNLMIYRESQKTWDLEDDLETFKRHSNKNERHFHWNKLAKN